MKDQDSLHLKVQEYIDCFAATDPLKEMSVIKAETDKDVGALKWLALATLHGINNNAEKIVISLSENDKINVTAEYRQSELPSPGSEIGAKVIQTIRDIIHLEGDKGKSQLSLGVRDSSLMTKVKIKTKAEGKKLTIKFPK